MSLVFISIHVLGRVVLETELRQGPRFPALIRILVKVNALL